MASSGRRSRRWSACRCACRSWSGRPVRPATMFSTPCPSSSSGIRPRSGWFSGTTYPSAVLTTCQPCEARRSATVVRRPAGPSVRAPLYCSSVSLYAHGALSRIRLAAGASIGGGASPGCGAGWASIGRDRGRRSGRCSTPGTRSPRPATWDRVQVRPVVVEELVERPQRGEGLTPPVVRRVALVRAGGAAGAAQL